MNRKDDDGELDVLVVAPHPDDAELGLGGTIVKLLQVGRRVGVLDLTSGEPTPFGSPEIRAAETAAASEALGLKWRKNLGLPNRSLEASLANRALLAGEIRLARPRWLFAPYWIDAHPDHLAATELIEAARFWAKLTKTDLPGQPWHPQRIFHYYCVHLKQHPQPAFVVDITAEWPAKKQALACFQSQFVVGKESVSPSFLEQLELEARWWGKTIGVEYGEPVACREPIGLAGLEQLI
jgi:bacillithiol biosynthesis deacetylase BshB1